MPYFKHIVTEEKREGGESKKTEKINTHLFRF